MYKGRLLLPFGAACLSFFSLRAQQLVTGTPGAGTFPIVSASADAIIYTDPADFILVQKSAGFLQQDIERVSDKKISHLTILPANSKNVIIIGSIEKSALIRKLIADKKINTQNIKGKWEAYLIQQVANPIKGISNALVIAGSDRRGVAFGVAEISQQIGVSPWYWWADVPASKKKELHISKGAFQTDAPKVKYRGIFINDEAPALSGWSRMTFGGFNHKFYEKVFELMIRLKSNYLWPAMWGNAFYDDDSLNIKMADDYGIVIGTSHHEPLMRAHDEWRRYGKGKWNYDSNKVRLKEFWKQGIQRATNEKIVSVGMRGDGDEPMSRETATALLEKIVKDQREIIEEVTKKPASETPQLWALYKEVQDYYDKGMRVPDDVTLLLCDDNWGNIRKLPRPGDPPRKGGYGIYYHFDYVGGPRNYKWVNTNPIARVWEQMHLAWEYKARDIWIVNVGDIKPMEFPISFFLDYAWNPEKIKATDLQKYTQQWAAAQFGKEHAVEIADIISKYTKYNGRRKPELLDANTYELYNEWRKITGEYNSLLEKAEAINMRLASEYRDAYFQLVLHPVKACANLNSMYEAVAWNRHLYKERYPEANEYADKVKELYTNDSLITLQYHSIGSGKWNHMMSQTHIGYTYWQQPSHQVMPWVKYLPADSAITEQGDTAISIQQAKYPLSINRNVFYEMGGYVSIHADHYTKANASNGVTWQVLTDHGRTGSAITTFPVTKSMNNLSPANPSLEYEFYTYSKDSIKLSAYFSPTLNLHNTAEGLQFAISIDNETPQVISLNKEDNNGRAWNQWVASNIIIKKSPHYISQPGKHTIKYYMISPAVVLQKIVLDLGGLRQSYLGPDETRAEMTR
jgi:hypothetical protein